MYPAPLFRLFSKYRSTSHPYDEALILNPEEEKPNKQSLYTLPYLFQKSVLVFHDTLYNK